MKKGVIMKKNILSVCFVLILSSQAFSFDFHGIKSGMTSDDVAALFNSHDKNFKSVYGDNLKKYNKLANSEYWEIYFSYTKDKKLWKITARILLGGYSTLDKIALKQALNEKYKGNTIQEDSETSSYGRSYYYSLILIDENLSDSEINKLKNEYSKKI